MAENRMRVFVNEWLADLDSPIDYRDLEIRFWGKVDLEGIDRNREYPLCLTWGGMVSGQGYGIFTIKGLLVLAHRVAVRIGGIGIAPRPIPLGMTVDHDREKKCLNKLCVNPYHLTVVTRSVNSGRNRNMSKFT
jgi:hypothetical protein